MFNETISGIPLNCAVSVSTFFKMDCQSHVSNTSRYILLEVEDTSDINPLSPSVKLQILLLCFHTFLAEVVGRSC